MQITMVTLAAGPDGIARRGSVQDLPELKARELIEGNFARPYDPKRDAKSPHGLQKPPETFES